MMRSVDPGEEGTVLIPSLTDLRDTCGEITQTVPMLLHARDVTISVLQKMERVEEMITEKNQEEDTSSRNNDFLAKYLKLLKNAVILGHPSLSFSAVNALTMRKNS